MARLRIIAAALLLALLDIGSPSQANFLSGELEIWHKDFDVNESGDYDAADIIYLVNFLYRSGPRPIPVPLVADTDCDGRINTADVLILANLIFKGIWPRPWPCYYSGYMYEDQSGATEADRLAMLLSGELTAPQDLKARAYHDLQSIRRDYGDAYPGAASLFFIVPWRMGHLIVGPEPGTLQRILEGDYTDWDSLNAVFHLEQYFQVGSGFWMWFDTELNTTAMSRLYAQLPGIRWAFHNSWLGDWPGLYPQVAGDTMKYVFRMAWGDCPAGCFNSQYWYFKTTPDSTWCVGFWDAYNNEPKPTWGDEALAIRWSYYRL